MHVCILLTNLHFIFLYIIKNIKTQKREKNVLFPVSHKVSIFEFIKKWGYWISCPLQMDFHFLFLFLYSMFFFCLAKFASFYFHNNLSPSGEREHHFFLFFTIIVNIIIYPVTLHSVQMSVVLKKNEIFSFKYKTANHFHVIIYTLGMR